MRFLVREQTYESLLASGRYIYRREGQATGAVEHWRLTDAGGGFRQLRVDLDARQGESGDSHLYHLVLGAGDRPERLLFRFRSGGGRTVAGNLQFDGDQISLSRQIDGQRQETELDRSSLPEALPFWFPASAGLSLLARHAPGEGDMDRELDGLTLNPAADLALLVTRITMASGPTEAVTIMGQSITARPLTLRWAEEVRQIWLDQYDWPVQMRRDGLTATENRYLRHNRATGHWRAGERIENPGAGPGPSGG